MYRVKTTYEKNADGYRMNVWYKYSKARTASEVTRLDRSMDASDAVGATVDLILGSVHKNGSVAPVCQQRASGQPKRVENEEKADSGTPRSPACENPTTVVMIVVQWVGAMTTGAADPQTAMVRATSLGVEVRSAKNCWHVKPDSARGTTTVRICFRDGMETVSGEVSEGK